MKPRVFISHSARHDERALKLLGRLEVELKAQGFDVLLDRTCLEVGDSWERKISSWLDQCHAAIVLFNRNALGSDYVRFEVSNLLHRWQNAGVSAAPFGLFPVLVEPLSEEELRAFYQAINLWAVQRTGPGDDSAIIETLVRQLQPFKDRLDTSGSDPTRALEGHVASMLAKIRDDAFLTSVAARLQLDTRDWPATNVAGLFAQAVVTSSPPKIWGAIRSLAPRLTSGELRKIFDLLMSLWVGLESARALESVTLRSGYRCAVLNAEYDEFTPGMYLSRAKAQQPSLAGQVAKVMDDGIGVRFEAALSVRVQEALRGALHLNLDEPGESVDTAVTDALASRDPDDPIVVTAKLKPELLPEFLEISKSPQFLGATFLALTNPVPADSAVSGITVLHPLLPAGLERQAHGRHKQCKQRLGSEETNGGD
jgi:hypothetical protein